MHYNNYYYNNKILKLWKNNSGRIFGKKTQNYVIEVCDCIVVPHLSNNKQKFKKNLKNYKKNIYEERADDAENKEEKEKFKNILKQLKYLASFLSFYIFWNSIISYFVTYKRAHDASSVTEADKDLVYKNLMDSFISS